MLAEETILAWLAHFRNLIFSSRYIVSKLYSVISAYGAFIGLTCDRPR